MIDFIISAQFIAGACFGVVAGVVIVAILVQVAPDPDEYYNRHYNLSDDSEGE